MPTLSTLTFALVAGTAQADSRLEHLMFETSLGGGQITETAYTDRMEDFGFDRSWRLFDAIPMFQGAVVYSPVRNLGVVFTAGNLDADSYHRDLLQLGDEDFDEYYRWTTWRSAVHGRLMAPMAGGWLVPYVQAGGGPAMAIATYTDEDCEQQDRHMGWHLSGAAGLQLMPTFGDHRYLGVFVQAETSWAPVLENLAGDVHDSGRRAFMLGIRAGY